MSNIIKKNLTNLLSEAVKGKKFRYSGHVLHLEELFMGKTGHLLVNAESYSISGKYKGKVLPYLHSNLNHLSNSTDSSTKTSSLLDIIKPAVINKWFKHEGSYYKIRDLDLTTSGHLYFDTEVYSLEGHFKGSFYHRLLSDNFQFVPESDLPMGPPRPINNRK